MTDRDKIREQLSAWLDGELSDADVRRLEKAVELDAELATELQQLRATRDLVRRLPRERAPEDFIDRVIARAERLNLVGGESQVEQPNPLRWIRMAATAAILLMAVGTGIVIVYSLFPHQFGENIAQDVAPADKQHETGKWSEPAVTNGDADGAGGFLKMKPDAWDGYCDEYYAKMKGGLDLEAELKNYYSSEIHNIEIYTDNLEIAEQDVVKVLGSNGIQPVKVAVANNLDRANTLREGDVDPLTNSFQVRSLNRAQVQIVVLVDEDQLAKLDKDLKKVISEQRVAQAPPLVSDGIVKRVGKEGYKYGRAGDAGGAESPTPKERAKHAVAKSTEAEAEKDKTDGDAVNEDENMPVTGTNTAGEEKREDSDDNGVASQITTVPAEPAKTKADKPEPTAEQVVETGEDRTLTPADKPAEDNESERNGGEKTLDDSRPGDEAETNAGLQKPESVAKGGKVEEPTPDDGNETPAVTDSKLEKEEKVSGREASSTASKSETTHGKNAAGTTTRPEQEGSAALQAGPASQPASQAERGQRRSQRLRPVLITLNDSEGLREVTIAKQRAAEKISASQSADPAESACEKTEDSAPKDAEKTDREATGAETSK